MQIHVLHFVYIDNISGFIIQGYAYSLIDTHSCIYIYIYIYMCVCVCMCVCVRIVHFIHERAYTENTTYQYYSSIQYILANHCFLIKSKKIILGGV